MTSSPSARSAREVPLSAIVSRMVASLVADGTAPREFLRTRLSNGMFVELEAPGVSTPVPPRSRLNEEVDAALHRMEPRIPRLAREAVRGATLELATHVEPTAIPELDDSSLRVARVLGEKGFTLATLIDAGAEAAFTTADSDDPRAMDLLLDRADSALLTLLDAVAESVRQTERARPSALYRDEKLRRALGTHLERKLRLSRSKVDEALDRAALHAS